MIKKMIKEIIKDYLKSKGKLGAKRDNGKDD